MNQPTPEQAREADTPETRSDLLEKICERDILLKAAKELLDAVSIQQLTSEQERAWSVMRNAWGTRLGQLK